MIQLAKLTAAFCYWRFQVWREERINRRLRRELNRLAAEVYNFDGRSFFEHDVSQTDTEFRRSRHDLLMDAQASATRNSRLLPGFRG